VGVSEGKKNFDGPRCNGLNVQGEVPEKKEWGTQMERDYENGQPVKALRATKERFKTKKIN